MYYSDHYQNIYKYSLLNFAVMNTARTCKRVVLLLNWPNDIAGVQFGWNYISIKLYLGFMFTMKFFCAVKNRAFMKVISFENVWKHRWKMQIDSVDKT